jgi:hypothetical protein
MQPLPFDQLNEADQKVIRDRLADRDKMETANNGLPVSG